MVDVGVRRRLCTKPTEKAPEPPPAPPAPAPPAPTPSRASFRVPGYKPTDWDRKMLIWSGRFKTPDQIPEIVSFEMLDAARNRVRVKACYVMMAVTIGACLVMVLLGKQAAGRHESLTTMNMEKKARWREELRIEREAATAAASLAEKPQ